MCVMCMVLCTVWCAQCGCGCVCVHGVACVLCGERACMPVVSKRVVCSICGAIYVVDMCGVCGV